MWYNRLKLFFQAFMTWQMTVFQREFSAEKDAKNEANGKTATSISVQAFKKTSK